MISAGVEQKVLSNATHLFVPGRGLSPRFYLFVSGVNQRNKEAE